MSLYKTYFQKQVISELVDKFPVTSVMNTQFITKIVLIHTTRKMVKKSNFGEALLRKRFILENLTNTTWSRRKFYHAKVGRPGADAHEFSMRYHTCLTHSNIYNFLQILSLFLKWRRRVLGVRKKILMTLNNEGKIIEFRLFNVDQIPWIAPDVHRTKTHVTIKLIFPNELFPRIFINRFHRGFGQYFTL